MKDIPLYEEKIDIRDILIDFLNAIQQQDRPLSKEDAECLYERIKKLSIQYK